MPSKIEYIICLTYNENGFFVCELNPRVDIGNDDYIALYETWDASINNPVSQKMKVNQGDFRYDTDIMIQEGYEARYIRNTPTGPIQIEVSDPFPPIYLAVTNFRKNARINKLILTYQVGMVAMIVNVLNFKEGDCIALYEHKSKENDQYIFQQPITSNGVLMIKTTIPFRANQVVRYLFKNESSKVVCAYASPPLDTKVLVWNRVTREPTLLEKESLQKLLFYDNFQSVQITGEIGYMYRYNCIASSLGFDDRWVEGASNFDKLRNMYICMGFVEVPKGSPNADVHVCFDEAFGGHAFRKYLFQADLWESKIGDSFRVTHRLDEVDKTLYGPIQISFKFPDFKGN